MIHIATAAVLLSIYVYFGYNNELRASKLFWFTAITYSIISNVLWVHLAKALSDKTAVFRYSFYWDTLLYLPLIMVPLAMGIKPSFISLTGIGLIVIGAVLFRLG